jgi:uncharacterized protein (TIGR01777 family)
MKILISGAGGVIGGSLVPHLRARGHEVVRLVRRPPGGSDERYWNPAGGELDPGVFDGVDAVVNLSGAGIGDRRWNDARRREILDSRIDTTGLLAGTMASLDAPPSLFVSASAIGYYGNRGDEVLTETSPAGSTDEFLTRVTIEWEAAADPAREVGIRVIHPRIGVVLAPGEQLLGRLVPLFKLGVGGPIGSGDQWWSWISLPDQVAALAFLLAADIEGAVNLVAPHPVTNREFADTLGELLRRPTAFTVPRTAIRLAMGPEMADELSLSSTRVAPERLGALGFEWRHETVRAALAELLGVDVPSRAA